PVTVQSVTFTGPSADTFMALVDRDSWPLDFGFGLVPGVFAGAFVSSLLRREFRIQTFDAESGMVRYLVGAVLMGFGGMLAGGCAVGAGITGGSVLALTSWIALAAMWFSAGLADHMLNRLGAVPAASPT
ncbi:MAG: YeeE/YedE family protein, partial [Geminicoccaceae bacterium]|nr:YeeE/YedE family protein [Geminicoccaceae bacterium]